MMAGLPPVLLVDDDENDVFVLQRSFAKANIPNHLHVVHTGEAAMDYLGGAGPYANRADYPMPGLVLLDMCLHGQDGLEVLAWLRQQPLLANLPVLILSGSENVRLITRAYELGANSVLLKPNDFRQSVELSQSIARFWLRPDKSSGPSPYRPTGDTQAFIRAIVQSRPLFPDPFPSPQTGNFGLSP